MSRLTFKKLEKAFTELNKDGFITKDNSNTFTVCFNFSENNIKSVYNTKYNTVNEYDNNKYYTYKGSLLDIAEKLNLTDLVNEHKNDTVYTMYNAPEETPEEKEAREKEFNDLFGF